MTTSTRQGRGPAAGAVITNAHQGASAEQSRRQRRYAITMAFRTACFVAMIFVPGPGRWVLFAGAVFLPYLAVVVANQADRRGQSFDSHAAVPSDAPQITTGETYEVIRGDVVVEPEPERRRDRAA